MGRPPHRLRLRLPVAGSGLTTVSDKLEAVLRGLGWSLVRVWSTEWWIDPEEGAGPARRRTEGVLGTVAAPVMAEAPDVVLDLDADGEDGADEDIALPEPSAAIRGCIDVDDPLTGAARQFGIRRLNSAARDRLKMAKPLEGVGPGQRSVLMPPCTGAALDGEKRNGSHHVDDVVDDCSSPNSKR
ncbi:hypothetical protein [Azospirillum sp. B506]|uniref:hypothetical protein n=1 Tax=Azospirillum sp. B506 TaxID=137721 RepID=UPI0011DE0B0A|nr:hypothetical protein [Azospirillum sp. B506]